MTPIKETRHKGLKRAGILLSVLAVAAAVGLLYVGNFFFQYALDPQAEVSFLAPELGPEHTPWLTAQGEDRWLTSGDGLRLHAWYAPVEDSHRYVILCHGYGNEAAAMADPGQRFHSMGFSVLLPDARASGQSEGRYIGMGWPERRDVVAWAQAIAEEDPQAEIVLYGVSMGAATVMMATGEADLPSNVKCAVEDCGYSSVWDEFAWQLEDLYGLPPVPVLNAASLVTKLRAGYFLGDASAVEQVKKSQTPTLFIHGDADTFVPFWMLDAVYEAAGCEKEKLVIPGAAHAKARSTDPVLYWSAVDEFLARYLE